MKQLFCSLLITSLLVGCKCTNEDNLRQKQASGPSSTQTITANAVSFKMVYVQGGKFQMGSEAYRDERPVHSVTLNSYYIGQTEVTQELWQAVMGSNPSYFNKGGTYPVEQVSWDDCQEFIGRLNQLTGKTFRLPTEAEWEYAARGGKNSKGYKYSGSNSVGTVAWYYGNSNFQTCQVASKQANELDIYDMSGNVYEWCSDWWHYYSSYSQTNPKGAASGTGRVSRGGAWMGNAVICSVSNRDWNYPDKRFRSVGVRLAMDK